jgi:integrase
VIVPPKTASSVRTLPLPDVLLQVVLRHRELQEQEREAYGPDWNRQDLVFPSTNGLPIWPRNVNVAFKRVLRAAGLPETMRFHDPRHSYATLLLQQGGTCALPQSQNISFFPYQEAVKEGRPRDRHQSHLLDDPGEQDPPTQQAGAQGH